MVAHAQTLGPARMMRVIAFCLMVVSGVTLIVMTKDYPIMSHQQWTWDVMCVFLAVGGGCAAFGQFTKTWTGEFIGLPLLGSAMLGFGVLQGGLEHWNLVVVPSVAILWAFGLVLISRWRDVSRLVKAATKGEPQR